MNDATHAGSALARPCERPLSALTRRERVERSIVLALALSLVALRFVNLDSGSFIQDEPLLQLQVDEAFEKGKLPLHAGINAKGVRYGPFPLWFYSLFRAVTDNITVVAAAWCCFFLLGLAALAWVIYREWGARVSAWLLLLVASSPYLFYYSRTPWDNVFLIPTCAILLVFVRAIATAPTERTLRCCGIAAGLGVTTGVALDIHPMSVPVIFGTGCWFLVHLLRWPRWRTRFLALFAFTVSFVAITLPYLLHALSGLARGDHLQWSGNGILAALEKIMVRASVFTSSQGMDYVLGDGHRAIIDGLGPLGPLYRLDPAWVLRIGALVFALHVGVRVARAGAQWREALSRAPLETFACVVLVAHFLYFYGVGVDVDNPHYMNAVSWVVPVFVAAWMATGHVATRRIVRVIVAVVAILNGVYVVAAGQLVARNSGIRTLHYGPARHEIEGAVTLVCQAMQVQGAFRATVDYAQTHLFDYSLRYFAVHAPACRGKQLSIGRYRQGEGPDAIVFQIRYRTENKLDASLKVSFGGQDVKGWIRPSRG